MLERSKRTDETMDSVGTFSGAAVQRVGPGAGGNRTNHPAGGIAAGKGLPGRAYG